MKYDVFGIGDRLCYARKARGIKQSDIARELKVDQSAYSRMETGATDITLATLFKVADLLDVSVYWILGGEENALSDLEKQELENYKNYLIYKRNR